MKKKDETKLKEYHEEIKDPKELKALEEIKNSLATITEPKDKAVLDLFILLDNDFLIRFLRARKLNIKKTTRMILDYYHWKAKMNIEDIYLNYQYKDKYKLQLLFPHGFHKTTKDGYPVYFEILGNFNADEFFNMGSIDEMKLYEIKLLEMGERSFKICSQIKGSYIYGFFSIMDFKGINTSILSTKFISYMKEMSKLQDYYPGNLAGCYAINAGFIFRSLYSICKYFLDEKNREVIKVFGEDYQQALLEKIDKENLPKYFGGDCECPGGCLFSNAGPWKKPGEAEEEVPEDIIKRRKELIDKLSFKQTQSSKDGQIKNIGKDGVNPEDL